MKNFIKGMSDAGHKLSLILTEVLKPGFVMPGMSTYEVEEKCLKLINQFKTVSPLKGYLGYPAHICTSVNEICCHGIPNKSEILKSGDLLGVDIVIKHQGTFYSDSAVNIIVGEETCERRAKINKIAQECLYLGIKQVRPNNTLYDIAKAIENHAKANNLHINEQFSGHGIGYKLHQDPSVLNTTRYDSQYLKNYVLKENMIFTIEPIVTETLQEAMLLADGWSFKNPENKLAAYWEHTVMVTTNSYRVLTKRNNEPI